MLRRLEYKWLVAIVFVFAAFMNLLDMTVTNVALPTFAREFSASTTSIAWVVTGYLLSLAVFIPVSGWVGDRFGTKRVFMFALSVFTLGSLLCGLAWSIEALIAFRLLQGMGGGILIPVGWAMIFRVFPPVERATAAAIIAIPSVVAPASGPILGGYLVEYHSWRWIFFINIPIGLMGFLAAGLLLREQKQENPGRLDRPGFLFGAAGLASLLYALADAGSHGFGDAKVLLFGLGGLTLLALFSVVELRTPLPMIDLRLLRDKLFGATNLVQIAAFAGSSGAFFLMPLLLQAEMGLSPMESGLATFPQAIGFIIMAQPVSRFYNRVGPRRMMVAGMFGLSLATLAFLLVDLETSQWWIRLIILAQGCAIGLVMVPVQAAAFATIRSEDTGRASAIYNAGRQVGVSFGVALLATVLTNRLGHYGAIMGDPGISHGALLAFHDAFIAAAVLTALGILVSLLVSDKRAAAAIGRAEAPSGERAVVLDTR